MRASCKRLGFHTIDDLIIHFSLGLIPQLSQIEGSGHWAGGNKASITQRCEAERRQKEIRVLFMHRSGATAASVKGSSGALQILNPSATPGCP